MADQIKNRPTETELQENIDKTLEELETPQENEEEENPEPTEEETEATEDVEEDTGEEEEKEEETEEVEEKTEEEESKEESTSQEPEEDEEESDPYKKRYMDSSREAHKLKQREGKMNAAMDEADNLPEPTEEEMKGKYGDDWDVMDSFQKQVAIDSYQANRKLDILARARRETKQIDDWSGKVDRFVDNPKTLNNYPGLEGKIDDFKQYASNPKEMNGDMDTIVKAFLFESETKKIDRNAKNKGKQMFPTGKSGGQTKPQRSDGMLSVEEGAVLMRTDYKKFRELLAQGKIRNY